MEKLLSIRKKQVVSIRDVDLDNLNKLYVKVITCAYTSNNHFQKAQMLLKSIVINLRIHQQKNLSKVYTKNNRITHAQ